MKVVFEWFMESRNRSANTIPCAFLVDRLKKIIAAIEYSDVHLQLRNV
jgi:hypothetical protein